MQDAAALVLADATFGLVDWTEEFVAHARKSKGAHADVQNVKKHVDCIHTGGNPGSFRQTVLQCEGSNGGARTFVSLANLHQHAVYDPAHYGRILGVDFSFDLLHIDNSPETVVKYSLLVRQDGILFVSPAATVSANKRAWRGYVLTNLSSDDFRRLSPPPHPTQPNPHPDFSSRGSPLQFGYLVQASTAAAELFSVTGIDNWKVLISSARADRKRMQELERLLATEQRERQQLERQLLEDRQRTEQEIRNLRLKAEEALVLRRAATGSSCSGDKLPVVSMTNAEEKAREYSGLLDNARAQMQRAEQERRAQKEAWERAVAHLRAEQQGLMHQLDAERSAKASLEKKMTAQLEEISSVHTSEKERLDQDLCKYRERISQLEKELRSECGARAKREDELKALREKAALADELKGSLFETQSLFEAKLKAHEEQLKHSEEAMAKRELELAEELREHADAVQRLQKELEHVKSARRQLELELQQKRRDWEADVLGWEEERETLRQQVDAAHREREATVREMGDRQEARVAEMARAMEEREREHERLAEQWRQEADAQRERLAATLAELGDAQQLLATKEAAAASMQRAMDDLQRRLDRALAENRAGEEQRQQLEEEAAYLAEEKVSLEKRLASERSAGAESARTLEEVRALYAEEKSRRQQDTERLRVALDDRAHAERAWEAQRAELQQRIASLEKQLKQQHSVVQVLREEALSRQRVEEELEAERAARVKAEDTLAKLTEIFQNSLHADEGEWELVPTDTEGQ